jgi:hypothetical protein
VVVVIRRPAIPIDEIPSVDVIDEAVSVIVAPVRLAPGAGLARVDVDAPGEVGVHEGDAGVEDCDQVCATSRQRPGIADPHPVEGVLVRRARVVDGHRGHRALAGQLDTVIGLGEGDRRISLQLGNHLLDGTSIGLQDGLVRRLAADLPRAAQPMGALDGIGLAGIAESHDHPVRRMGRKRCARPFPLRRRSGRHRPRDDEHRRGDQEQAEQRGSGTRHWAFGLRGDGAAAPSRPRPDVAVGG